MKATSANPDSDLLLRTVTKLQRTAERLQDSMPYTTVAGRYQNCESVDPSWWTNSFWAGLLWLLYRETNEARYRVWAESVEAKLDQVLLDYNGLHHDVGFQWLLTAVLSHETTGNAASRSRALLAASVLASRFNLSGGFIRAWNWDQPGLTIIDCLMNLPLLYWASRQTDDDRFAQIARAHTDKVVAHYLRDDGSVPHIVVFDAPTGAKLDTPRGQGFAAGSSWSRGQAWALYGLAQGHRWTGQATYLEAARRVAAFLLRALPATGYLPPCDYAQPAQPERWDSSAGAVTACGFLELAAQVPASEGQKYANAAECLLSALETRCLAAGDEALLTLGTSAYHTGDSRWDVVHGALIYGDYYFLEALLKLRAWHTTQGALSHE